MPYDVYTKQLISTSTEEHVLPRSLGGKLSVVGIIDKTTNDHFGHGIDARLDEALRPLRVILDAPNSDGAPPRSLSKVVGDDGKKYTVEAGGKVRPPPKGTQTLLPTGELHFEASISDGEELANMLRKTLKRKGVDLSTVVAKALAEGTIRKTATPAVTFKLPLWEADPYRATAKIAFNLFALLDPERALASDFDAIRGHILSGAVLSVPPVQPTQVPAGFDARGQLDHLVLLDVQASGEIVASVTYFGHLGLVVRLGASPGIRPRRVSYRVDQLVGADYRDAPEDLALQIPSFEEAAARTFEQYYALIIGQANRCVAATHQAHQKAFLARITAPILAAVAAGADDQGRITPEQARIGIREAVKAIADEMRPNIEQAGGSAADFERSLCELMLAQLEEDRDLLLSPGPEAG